MATGKQRPPVKLAPGRGATRVLVSPDGTKLITFEPRSYDAKGARHIPFAAVFRDLAGAGRTVELAMTYAMAAFAPDGRTFVLASSDREKGEGRLRLFNALSGKETSLLVNEPEGEHFLPRSFHRTASGLRLFSGQAGKTNATGQGVGRGFSPGGGRNRAGRTGRVVATRFLPRWPVRDRDLRQGGWVRLGRGHPGSWC